jgi:hypothetical protein
VIILAVFFLEGTKKMSRLDPEKLHVKYLHKTERAIFTLPRRYTLTHSDRTGDLFLSIGSDYNRKQISGLYTRLMRDEVLAEWKDDQDGPSLHVYCHVSGGLAFGPAAWREKLIRSEMPLVLEALRFGDHALFEANSQLDNVRLWVHFEVAKRQNNKVEEWGVAADYRI